jgi:hypothetical protein
MTAKADSRRRRLLQLAPAIHPRDKTAALNITRTASVAAVERTTPIAINESIGGKAICILHQDAALSDDKAASQPRPIPAILARSSFWGVTAKPKPIKVVGGERI